VAVNNYNMNNNIINLLPRDVFVKIFIELNFYDVLNFMLSCHEVWNYFSTDDEIWNNVLSCKYEKTQILFDKWAYIKNVYTFFNIFGVIDSYNHVLHRESLKYVLSNGHHTKSNAIIVPLYVLIMEFDIKINNLSIERNICAWIRTTTEISSRNNCKKNLKIIHREPYLKISFFGQIHDKFYYDSTSKTELYLKKLTPTELFASIQCYTVSDCKLITHNCVLYTIVINTKTKKIKIYYSSMRTPELLEKLFNDVRSSYVNFYVH